MVVSQVPSSFLSLFVLGARLGEVLGLDRGDCHHGGDERRTDQSNRLHWNSPWHGRPDVEAPHLLTAARQTQSHSAKRDCPPHITNAGLVSTVYGKRADYFSSPPICVPPADRVNISFVPRLPTKPGPLRPGPLRIHPRRFHRGHRQSENPGRQAQRPLPPGPRRRPPGCACRGPTTTSRSSTGCSSCWKCQDGDLPLDPQALRHRRRPGEPRTDQVARQASRPATPACRRCRRRSST